MSINFVLWISPYISPQALDWELKSRLMQLMKRYCIGQFRCWFCTRQYEPTHIHWIGHLAKTFWSTWGYRNCVHHRVQRCRKTHHDRWACRCWAVSLQWLGCALLPYSHPQIDLKKHWVNEHKATDIACHSFRCDFRLKEFGTTHTLVDTLDDWGHRRFVLMGIKVVYSTVYWDRLRPKAVGL